MLSVKANKKMVQQHIYRQAGKIVTLKDLQNISDKDKSSMIIDANTLVEEMKKVDGKIQAPLYRLVHSNKIGNIFVCVTVWLVCSYRGYAFTSP